MKRGQMQLSFGMIFSIFLIVVLMGFGFYVIMQFLDFQTQATAGIFFDDLQNDVNNVWRSEESSIKVSYNVPSSVEYVCFVDFSSAVDNLEGIYSELELISSGDKNVFVYPVGSGEGSDGKNVLHLDVPKTVQRDNPKCVKAIEGKVEVLLKKNYGESLVYIE